MKTKLDKILIPTDGSAVENIEEKIEAAESEMVAAMEQYTMTLECLNFLYLMRDVSCSGVSAVVG